MYYRSMNIERADYWQNRMRPLLAAINREWDGQTRFLSFVLKTTEWQVTIVRQEFFGVGDTPDAAAAALYALLLKEVEKMQDHLLDAITNCHAVLKSERDLVKDVMSP